MARVPSLWYDDGHGKDFHAKDKPLFLGVVIGLTDFNTFKNLIIRPEWLRFDQNDKLTPSMVLAMKIRDEYIREMAKLLKGEKWINRMAVHKLANFLVVLHINDDMYYERFGYLMYRFIQRSMEWADTDKDGRIKIIQEERALYFTHEGRQDRLQQITAAWDFFERLYRENEGIEQSVNFVIGRLNVHRAEFNYDEVSRLGMTAFHPECWYPRGRGQLWDMAHGGKG